MSEKRPCFEFVKAILKNLRLQMTSIEWVELKQELLDENEGDTGASVQEAPAPGRTPMRHRRDLHT